MPQLQAKTWARDRDSHHRFVWDGSEVWLIAGGGTLYFAFPLLYASGFRDFYLPLNIVLQLLMLRGIPLGADHFFFEPLWTNSRTGADTDILDCQLGPSARETS